MTTDFNHFTGYYTGEKYTPAQKYRDERKKFNEFLKQINEEYRLLIIQREIDKCLNQLKNLEPELYELFIEGIWYEPKYRKSHMHQDEASLLASYIEYLYILQKQYEEFALMKSVELRWIKDYEQFVKLYHILTKFGIIETNFLNFRNFFYLKEKLFFNTKIFDTVVIFYELAVNGFISELTTLSLFEKELIFSKNGKKVKNGKNSSQSLTQKQYIDHKSHYKKDVSGSYCDENVVVALKMFGIDLLEDK